MPIAPANGIDICYESIGDPGDPALLLVMGFTAQMTMWDDAFCAMLAGRGRHVIRLDNRDCGLSTHFDGVTVDLPAVLAAWDSGDPMPPVPYDMHDFAADAVGLLDHLQIQRAHIVGASMGGMIVQAMAIDHPDRVLSMTSIMSTTGEKDFYKWDPATRAALWKAPPADRAGYVEHSVATSKLLGGTRHFDAAEAARRAGAAHDRSFYPEGSLRQSAAIRASGDRADGLRGLRVPTLVIHGREDTLIKPIGGERTAELVAGANLLLMHDMGHDLPRPLWPILADAIISHTTHGI